MKKFTFSRFSATLGLCLVLALLAFVSCEKVEDLLTFKISNETNFTIPSAIGINTPTLVPTPDVTTNSNQEFQSNNTDASKVKDIKLESLKLTITAPSGATFAPVKSIRIYISAQGLGEKLLAFKDNIPTDIGSTLTMDTTGEKLDDYIKKDFYSLRTEVVTRQAVFQDTDIKANMVFSVTANL